MRAKNCSSLWLVSIPNQFTSSHNCKDPAYLVDVKYADGNSANSPRESASYREVERVKGIEPSYEAWEAAVLPLNYTRIS